MGNKRIAPLCLVTFILLLTMPAYGNAGQEEGVSELTPIVVENGIWTWSDNADKQHAIFVSRQTGPLWGLPEKISNNNKVNVVPAATRTGTGEIIVTWAAFDGQQSQLRYTIYRNDNWSEEQVYYSGLNANTAPALAVDTSDTLWLVWAGFNGVSDEIYYATFEDGKFGTAQPITANNIPDILPVLGVDATTGNLWLQWQQYTDSGYVDMQSIWNGTAWSTPVQVVKEDADAAAPDDPTTTETPSPMAGLSITASTDASTDTQYELLIPEFVTTPDTASVHIPGYAIQSLPMRSVAKVD